MADLQAVGLSADLQAGLAGVADGPGDGAVPEQVTDVAAKTAPRQRARARAKMPAVFPVAPVAPLDAFVSPFGASPPTATHWGIKKRNSLGEWHDQTFAPPGATIEGRDWPLSELTIDTLYERWGAGDFEVVWIAAQPRGGIKKLRGGRQVTVRPREAAPAPVAAAAAPVRPKLLDGPLGEAFDMINMIQGLAGSKASETIQFATVLAQLGGRGGGITGEELRSIMRDEREANQALLAASEARVKAEVAAALAARGEDDDDEEDGPDLAAAARAASGVIKGKGFLPTLLNWANGNPDVAKEVVKYGLPILAGAATKIAEIVAGPPAPVQRQVAQPRQQPIAPVTSTPVHVDSAPVVSASSSLSSWPGEAAQPPPVTTPAAS